MQSRKGNLIFVLMFGIIFSILLGGLFFLINSQSQVTYRNIHKSQIYYATESGMKYVERWLQALPVTTMIDTTACDLIQTNMTAFKLFTNSDYDVDVELNADYDIDANLWTLTSAGTRNGTTCTITYSNIKPATPLENCYFNGANNNWGGAGFLSETHFFGKTYFNTKVAINKDGDANTTFWGKTVCTKNANTPDISDKFKSTVGNSEGSELPFWTNEGAADELSDYLYGITALSDFENLDKIEMKEALDQDVFKGGYVNDYNEFKEMPDICKNYSEIKAEFTTYEFTGSGDISFDFREDGTIFIKESGSNDTIFTQGAFEVLAVSDNYDNVSVKGCFTKDVSVMTNSDDIHVVGNIYTPKTKDFIGHDIGYFTDKEYTQTDDTHNVNRILDTDNDIEIGLMAGLDFATKNDIIVDASSEYNNERTGLITAVLFAPNGEYRWDSAAGWGGISQIALYGGFIGQAEGLTADGNTNGKGFAPVYISSRNFLNGEIAPGFNTSTYTYPYDDIDLNGFSDLVEWNVEWTYN